MNSITAVFIRTSRSIRRATNNLLNRLTRKASLKLSVTVSLPPFVKFAIDYTADLSRPEKSASEVGRDQKNAPLLTPPGLTTGRPTPGSGPVRDFWSAPSGP